MNLADAIRKAAIGNEAVSEEPLLVAERSVPQTAKAEVVELPVTADADDEQNAHQEPATVVRLELTLSPDQLQSLFRTVMNTQRSILTIREAATYLRLSVATVEKMAEAQEIPAFKMDGRWRFSRTGLQEWMTLPATERRIG